MKMIRFYRYIDPEKRIEIMIDLPMNEGVVLYDIKYSDVIKALNEVAARLKDTSDKIE